MALLSPAPIIKSQVVQVTTPLVVKERKGRRTGNPFHFPEGANIFVLRNEEKERRKKELEEQRSLKVHEKVSLAGRARSVALIRRNAKGPGLFEEEPPLRAARAVWMDALMKDRNIERESINEYVAKKREMFLMEYSAEVKRGEIERLQQLALSMEKKLEQAERHLEEDTAMFDEFLKENDRNSVAAIQMAEQETKLKLEKVMEIKRITAKMVAVKSDISKYEDKLKEYMLYKDFLFKLSPPEWQEQQRIRREERHQARHQGQEKSEKTAKRESLVKTPQRKYSGDKSASGRRTAASHALPPVRDAKARRSSKQLQQQGDKTSEAPEHEDGSSEYEDEPELFFSDPQQLLDLLTELEEQNLSLIQNTSETEDSIEGFQRLMEKTRKEMEKEMEELKMHVEVMTYKIQREQEKVDELELKVKLFDFGELKFQEQDTMLDKLKVKVGELYHCCVGESGGTLSTLQMLAVIEGRLEELMDRMENIPKDKLLLAEKNKERERRIRMREEKASQQKQIQEERIKKALERSQADYKRFVGKKLMSRSQPPSRKLNVVQQTNTTDREKEDHLFFFKD
ncbi:cilia- and flagella-associated protein 100 [Engraulis encrasicolus]|uniref:cilia- and flagella-associated protein 100 n=1 Tax=Engraulis encrasicolus TaxID=184585 RepID=UPI002FD6CE7D